MTPPPTSMMRAWMRGLVTRLRGGHRAVVGALLAALAWLLLDALLLNPAPEATAHAAIERHSLVESPRAWGAPWAARGVSEADRRHLARLHEGCMRHRDAVVFGRYGRPHNDATPSSAADEWHPIADVDYLERTAAPGTALALLRQCPDVDVYHPAGLRGHGYCEDAAAYVKYLNARLLPRWVLERAFTDDENRTWGSYHELCPDTPMLFLGHYWDAVPEMPTWPPTKPLYVMPNIEMPQLEPRHLWAADAVLCKTAICARRVRRWYQQHGSPRNARIFFTKHTTSDIAALARLEDDARGTSPHRLQPKDFTNVRFVHAVGGSYFKGTRQVLECWQSRPDFPPLELVISRELYEDMFEKRFGALLAARPHQITLHREHVNASAFARLVAESAFFLCPSTQEGYGHYINQIRASGGLVLTTDAPPMNEFITPASGIVIPVRRRDHERPLLGGSSADPHGLTGVEGLYAEFRGRDVCDGVERLLALTSRQRAALARHASAQYEFDTNFFATRMDELRVWARAHRSRAQQRRQRQTPTAAVVPPEP